MAARRRSGPKTDRWVVAAMGGAAIAAFVGQFIFGTHPAYFVPIGICALPFAATRGRELAYRVVAAVLLAGFIALVGVREGSLFVPSLVLLAAAAVRRGRGTRR